MKTVVPLLVLAVSAGAQTWTPLFNGHSLDGWESTGTARWTVENGMIVGRQGADGSAGDLFTQQRFKDFEVEAEWSMMWPGNSGFWFRYRGAGTGCQADFLDQADQPGILSGSIYCIGPGFVAENRDPKTVNKDGWNKLRMTVQGDKVQVWMNDAPVASATVTAFRGPGKVGLQVHPGKEYAGMEIRLRSARIRKLP